MRKYPEILPHTNQSILSRLPQFLSFTCLAGPFRVTELQGYRPQFYFRTTDVTGDCALPEGTEMVMPGDNIKMVVTLISPIAMEEGLRFAIREGGHTVGAGVVSKIIA